MTNEQTAALLYGIARAINRLKYDVTNVVGPVSHENETEKANVVYRMVGDLENEVQQQIKSLFGLPPC